MGRAIVWLSSRRASQKDGMLLKVPEIIAPSHQDGRLTQHGAGIIIGAVGSKGFPEAQWLEM